MSLNCYGILYMCTVLQVGMLIFANFISRYENFKSRDSSSTQSSTWHWEMVRERVRGRAHLPSPHPLGINYRRVEARLLRLLARSRPVSRRQVDVPGRVSAVRRQAAATDSS